jgi:hypothetical protein
MEKITKLIEQELGEKELFTNNEIRVILKRMQSTENKILARVHKDGKNTILSNETSNEAIKRLFYTLH